MVKIDSGKHIFVPVAQNTILIGEKEIRKYNQILVCTYYNGKWSTDNRKQGKNRVFHTGWVLILPKYSMYPYVNNVRVLF